jgi:hypothetical protein
MQVLLKTLRVVAKILSLALDYDAPIVVPE